MMIRTFLLLAISASALGYECQTKADKGASYRGSVSKTESGRTCQAWDEQTPHKHSKSFSNLTSNFCRNPDGEDGVWCYTMDSEKRWELCDVPMKETCPGDGSSSTDIVEQCDNLKERHHALILARLAHHCKDSSASGEATQCDKDLVMELNSCELCALCMPLPCILGIVDSSPSCNSTEIRCSTLDRLIDASSNSRALDCYTHMPDQRSGCSWYQKLKLTSAVWAAYSVCRDHEIIPCIKAATKVIGASTACICDIIPANSPGC